MYKRQLQDYLKDNSIVGIEHIDTRALVRHIRDKGAMRAGISTVDLDKDSLLKKILATPEMQDVYKRQVICDADTARKFRKHCHIRILLIYAVQAVLRRVKQEAA